MNDFQRRFTAYLIDTESWRGNFSILVNTKKMSMAGQNRAPEPPFIGAC